MARSVFGVSVGYHTTLALEPLFFWYDYLPDLRLEVDVQVPPSLRHTPDIQILCAMYFGYLRAYFSVLITNNGVLQHRFFRGPFPRLVLGCINA